MRSTRRPRHCQQLVTLFWGDFQGGRRRSRHHPNIPENPCYFTDGPLEANPRIHVHFTPTSGSWLNMVEVWFGIIERQAIRRGSFPTVRDLMIRIREFITGWNQRKHPFIWTKPAEQVLAKIDRNRKHVTTTHH